MPEPAQHRHTPRCIFCGKSSRRRVTRRERYWKCKYCHEVNPGDGMLKAMAAHYANPPAIAAHVNGTASQPAPAKVAATTIRGAATPAAKAVPPPAVVKPTSKASPQPKPPAPRTPPPAKKGVLEQIAARVYG